MLVPALFVHGRDDEFVAPAHSEALAEVYGGDHNLVLFEGDHNSSRPRFLLDSIAIFLSTHLLAEEDLIAPTLISLDNPLVHEERPPLPPPSLSRLWSNRVEDELALAMRLSLAEGGLEEEEEEEEDDLALAMRLSLEDQGGKPSQPPPKKAQARVVVEDDEELQLAIALSLRCDPRPSSRWFTP